MMPLHAQANEASGGLCAGFLGAPAWIQFGFLVLVFGMVWFVLAGLRGRRCLYCRKRNRPQAVYCAECGHRLDKPPRKLE